MHLKNIDGRSGNQDQINRKVEDVVQRLKNMDQQIETGLGEIGSRGNNIQIGLTDTGLYDAGRLTYGNGIQNENVINFFNNAKYTPYGRLIDNSTGSDINISINTIDDDTPDRGNLETDYSNRVQLNLTDELELNKLTNRLANCQYLEILYLTKHEELMKLFAFTLNLFNKYKYAIRILLYVLKNLLDARDREPPREPHREPPREPRPHECPQCPTVDLPAALIPNIKSLIIDQKKVQDVMNQMQEVLNRDQLATPENSESVANPPAGNLGDVHSPRDLRR